MVYRLINGFFTLQASFQIINMLLFYSIGPQLLLKIHRIHIDDVFKAHRN